MKRLNVTTRRALRCGWEPRLPNDGGRAWWPGEASGPKPETCPGYTTDLPEVIIVARAYLHWDKGQLQLRDPDPPPEIMDGIEVISSAVMAVQTEMMRRKRGGHGDR